VPGGPVYSYQQVFDDPHVKARAMVVEMEHPIMGTIKTFGSPVKSSGELVSIRRAAPWLGQHSEEILRSLGIAEDEIKSLFDEAIIFDRQRV
jgi:crotonobetainyl-CoA:carnitine CoA-transferase CaiB-like acyl-CoA transferase